MTIRLTEANYVSRKLKLEALHRDAQAAFDEVALRREIDEATDAHVAEARAIVTTLGDRLKALDAARGRARQQEAVEAEQETVERRRADAEAAKTMLARRASLAADVDDAVRDLGDALRALASLDRDLFLTLGPWRRDAIASDTHREEDGPMLSGIIGTAKGQELVAGMLYHAGLNNAGRGSLLDLGRHAAGRSLVGLVQQQNERIAATTVRAVPELADVVRQGAPKSEHTPSRADPGPAIPPGAVLHTAFGAPPMGPLTGTVEVMA